jgi:hypothetical protein
MHNVAQSTPEGTHAPIRTEPEDLHGQLLHALKLAAGGPFDATEGANAEDFAECVTGELAAELLAVAHDERGFDDLPLPVANHLVSLHARARAVHLALRVKREGERPRIGAVSVPPSADAPVAGAARHAHEAMALVGELLKYTAKAKDDTIDTVVALNSHGGDSWDGTRQDATRALGALRNIQDIAIELRAILGAAPPAVNDKAAE